MELNLDLITTLTMRRKLLWTKRYDGAFIVKIKDFLLTVLRDPENEGPTLIYRNVYSIPEEQIQDVYSLLMAIAEQFRDIDSSLEGKINQVLLEIS